MSKRKRQRRDNILETVRLNRQASRLIQYEKQIPQVSSRTFLSHKKDKFDKTKNTIKDTDNA